MLERLRIVKQRFDEVSDLIIQPDIISDQKRYIKLTKEYKDLKILTDKGTVYEKLLNNFSETSQKLFTNFSEFSPRLSFSLEKKNNGNFPSR